MKGGHSNSLAEKRSKHIKPTQTQYLVRISTPPSHVFVHCFDQSENFDQPPSTGNIIQFVRDENSSQEKKTKQTAIQVSFFGGRSF